ncbi:hypothetical protein LRR81_01425 [Metabacillus sp. GX 13764]|uniref:hypothetical protein n=1 Tax=Metabacillus kandeliae TaxID=2900151 RepID=UPI001E518009|nr:hypothetical protein [Metabacillus kandeliae]MCD7032871.1 hypothetical protein [Metabacillus kandeliae]
MYNETIIKKCVQLGIYTSVYLSKALWKPYIEDEEEKTQVIQVMSEYIEGIEYLFKVLKIKYDERDFLDSIKNHTHDSSLTNNIKYYFKNDTFGNILEDKYGKYANLVYSLTILIGLNKQQTSALSIDLTYEDLETNPDYVDMLNEAKSSLEVYIDFLNSNRLNIQNMLPEILPHATFLIELETVDDLISNKSIDTHLEYFKTVDNTLNQMLNSMTPHYFNQLDRLSRGKKLISELNNCKTGEKNWKNYEDICIKILNFLFVPPFSEVKEQSRTESGDSRRDGVLPNNKHSGFWEMVRNEFKSRHIICEFKNYSTDVGKDQLNQLRIYLSKPTIGRFGLLFLRKKPSKKLLEARKRAYEEGNILILLLDDELIIEMIKMAIYADSPEFVLEDLKIQFELTY